MKFLNLVRYAFGLAAASVLVSCGGGGAEQRPIDAGTFGVNPSDATFYAGVKYTMQIVGGTAPFRITSSDQTLLPVPAQVATRNFDVVGNQPGVVDPGLTPNELQVKTVQIIVRSAEGNTGTASIKVAVNFLTGYGVFVLDSTCTGGVICRGGDIALGFDSTLDGVSHAGRVFRIEKVSGPFQFIDPLNSNNQVDAVTLTSDTEGKFVTRIRVASGVPAQVAIIKVIDVATGVYAYRTLTISTTPPTATITLIPNTINLTGPDATTCGFGNTDVLAYDGARPYSMLCPDPRTFVSTPTSDAEPGRFTVTVGAAAAGQCLTGVQCIVTDSNGTRGILTINTTVGAAGPAPTPLTVAPNSITLSCGQSGSVTVVGGSGTYSANSSHQRVTAVVSGNTVTITRLTGDTTPPAPFPTSGTVTITDGSSIGSVAVSLTQATCP